MFGFGPMLTDLILAILHHLAIVTLIVLLAFEFALLRPGITPDNLRRVTNVDAALRRGCGAGDRGRDVAGDLGRQGRGLLSFQPVVLGQDGEHSVHRAALHSAHPGAAEMAKGAQAGMPDFLPADAEVARLRRFLHAEVGLLALVVAFAAAMARYGAF